MRRWRGLEAIPADWGECVVSIGVFDGVHRGHQYVLGRALERGRDHGLPTVAVTFDPRPIEVLSPDHAPPVLTGLATRLRLLTEAGADAVLVLSFTRELSQLSPEEFVEAVLAERLHARVVVVGQDFRFGHKAAGNVALLAGLGESHDFSVEAVAPAGDGDVVFSSSAIRERVAVGDVVGAAALLGRPHRIEGTVERGAGRGREMGYPTANLAYPSNAAVPADGVYAGWLRANAEGERAVGEACPAAISIGTNPTFSGDARQVEAYVLDRRDLDLYGTEVAVEFVAWVRETLRFDSVPDLVAAMDRDVRRVRDVLAASVEGRSPAG